jgi:hypothetical protein
MSSSLPRHPSIDLLKKQAKMLRAAHRRGAPASCELLRRIRRFSGWTNKEILETEVSLGEAQLALAKHYGFGNWKELSEAARSYPPSSEFSLDGVRARSEEPIPDYAGAGVPLGVVAALNHAGFPVSFMEFAAVSGWSFSFSYLYRDISPAFMAVRGNPDLDGPTEIFAFLPGKLGLGYEMALTGDPEELWEFCRKKVDAGVPVMSEHMDGGLIVAHRTHQDRRQLFFDGTVDSGWKDAGGFNPYAVYSFVEEDEPRPMDEIVRAALSRAVEKGRPHEWNDVPQGLAALRSYLADVQDPTKDFKETQEWFCWAAFERLMARRCSEVWLRSVGERFGGDIGEIIADAADRYGDAFLCYDQYLGETQGCDPPRATLRERVRAPERIQACAPLLEKGIQAEASGLEILEKVVYRIA